MRKSFQTANRSRPLSAMTLLASVVLVIGILYWAREILIPIALAILLTFILAPIVTGLRRRGVGRTLSVILTVVFTFALLGAIGAMIVVEFRSLANELPAYRQNIRKKIADVRVASKGGAVEKVQDTVNEVMEEFRKEDTGAGTNRAAVPVVVTRREADNDAGVTFVGPLLAPLASAGLVIVLVIFMLLRREDLRDRLLRLAGYGRLAATTKAIDEAGKRVSSYLLRQFLLNAGFGVGIGTGLFFIGLPYAALWGFLAAVARFIPYFGPWLGALAPILMSLAVFDGWTAPFLVIGLVIGLELVNNMILEPLIYGRGIGISEVALLIMIAFWTWLWGPIGLILAAPLTVCLMVISKGVPELEFIALLLGSEPALAAHHVLYQRLIAKDEDEALETVDAFLKEHSRIELFDQLLIPTLIASRQDRERDRLNDEDQQFIFGVIRQILDEGEGLPATGIDAGGNKMAPGRRGALPATAGRSLILGCPANDEADELALLMLAELLQAEHWPMRVLSSAILASESIAEVERTQAAVICVGCLPEGPLFPARQFCKRLRSRVPEIPIIVGRWAAREREKTQHQLSGLAEAIGWSLAETKNQVVQFAQISWSKSQPSSHAVASAKQS